MSVHKDKKRGTWYFRKRVYNFEGRLVHVNRSGYKTKYEVKVAELSFDE